MEIYIMQMLSLIERWAEDANGFSIVGTTTLGEEGKDDSRDNNNNSTGGDINDNNDANSTKSINGRMDSNGRVHDTLGQFMAKAGFTSKPSLTTAVEEVVETAETGETDGGGTSENAIIK